MRSGNSATGSPPTTATRGLVADTVFDEHWRRLERLEADEAGDARVRAISLHRRETGLRLRALRAQRSALGRLLRAQSIDDDALRLLQRELDIEEAALLAAPRTNT